MTLRATEVEDDTYSTRPY